MAALGSSGYLCSRGGTIDLAAERQTALQRLVPLVAFYTSFTLLVVGLAMAYAANRPLAAGGRAGAPPPGEESEVRGDGPVVSASDV